MKSKIVVSHRQTTIRYQILTKNKTNTLVSFHSLRQVQQELGKKAITLPEIVKHYLNVIKEQENLNVFVEVYEREALERAELLQQKLEREEKTGNLFGLVVGIKDVLVQKNHKVTAGSKILDGFESQFTATAVKRLLQEDAIIIGSQNCDEFAMGSSNEHSAYGPTKNAADPTRVPGGSSGASAVAVQSGMCMASLGSDTGGSVRQPAAFCGVIGLKPTYSRVSRHGLIAYASSFDCIGIFTKTVEDNALLLEVIAGEDSYDSTVSKKPVPAYSADLARVKKYKVAYIDETLTAEGLQKEIKDATLSKIEQIKVHGHSVEAVSFPLMEYLLPTYYILTTAESSTNLSRYDGVRYGYRSPHASDMESMYKLSRSEGFGEEVKRRIMLGTFVLSARYHDAYFTKAQKVRRLIQEETNKMLNHYDFIVLPTTPTTAFPLNSQQENPAEMYLADVFTVQANVSGIPAISIPNGNDKQGLPIGFQIMSKSFNESELFAFANSLM